MQHYFVCLCFIETCTRLKGHVSFSFKHLCPKCFWSSIYLTSYVPKLCRNTHKLSCQVVTKLTEEHTHWNGLPFSVLKLSNIKFHENVFRVPKILHTHTHTDRWIKLSLISILQKCEQTKISTILIPNKHMGTISIAIITTEYIIKY